MQFSKMHGLGNDFVVVDAVTQNAYFTPETIKRLADRHRGIGFDQLLIVEPPYDPDLDFHYRIFNADGSEVSQCGNGARCFARFVTLKGLIWEPNKIPFTANKFEKNYILRTDVQTVLCGAVSMGNPHCVVQVDNIETANVAELGPLLESHERFPERVNAGFMQVVNRNHIKLRVYERGAGETQACGSGACAAAAVGMMQGLLDNKVQVDLPGGSLLIEWEGVGSPLYMTGDATHIYDGNIHL